MKKILFGSAAALCTVVGLSAFKSTKTFSANYFSVKTTVNRAVNTGAKFKDADVTKLTGDPGSCTQSGTGFDCVLTFAASQLTANLNHIKTVGGIGQQPQSTIYTRAQQ